MTTYTIAYDAGALHACIADGESIETTLSRVEDHAGIVLDRDALTIESGLTLTDDRDVGEWRYTAVSNELTDTDGVAYRYAVIAPSTVLSRLVDHSGLSIAEFARVVVGRDERTVRRWLSGEILIPESAASWLARVVRVDATSGRVTVVLDR